MSIIGSPLTVEALRQRAQALIPAGAHTYSKGDDQFPANAPAFIVRGAGARCWDVDGREYVDWGMGLRSVILGHAYQPVVDAAAAQLALGANFTRPSPLESQLAERLVGLIPAAEMVKLAKNGSDVTSGAVRLARAFTGRDYIARCASNPFLSFGDWFIGSTVVSAGIPEGVRAFTLQFDYNNLGSLERLFDEHPGKIACVVMEPATTEHPAPGYLEAVKRLTHHHGAVLVFDEMITGFRWHLRGAQHYYGVTPDMATFGKALGNGFSVSALVGRRDIMERGGLSHAHPRVFLLSATHGGETHALAAALATLDELETRAVCEHIWSVGELLQREFEALARELGIHEHIALTGLPCSLAVTTRDHDGQPSLDYRALFLQETIARGVLMPWLAISHSHRQSEIDQTLDACRHALAVYRRALEARSVRPLLVGPAVKPVFRPFN